MVVGEDEEFGLVPVQQPKSEERIWPVKGYLFFSFFNRQWRHLTQMLSQRQDIVKDKISKLMTVNCSQLERKSTKETPKTKPKPSNWLMRERMGSFSMENLLSVKTVISIGHYHHMDIILHQWSQSESDLGDWMSPIMLFLGSEFLKELLYGCTLPIPRILHWSHLPKKKILQKVGCLILTTQS